MITESDVINYVVKHAKYMSIGYVVDWNGKSYQSNDTRDLVIQICKDEKCIGVV